MRRNQRTGMTPFAAGMLGVIIVVVITYLGFTKSIPFRHHFEIKAAFQTANNVKQNSAVRIAGVNVGKVTKVDFLHKGQPQAVVTMRIDKKGLPIHKDATMMIRPRIFLEGNFFVDIKPGSPSSPVLGDGDMVPANQTSTPVQLDQILTSLQSDTREDLQRLLREFSKGFDGQGGAGYNRSIPYWKGAYKGGAIVSDALLGKTKHDLSGYVKQAGSVAEALDRNSVQLKSLVTDFNTTAHALAIKDKALEQAIKELPRTLSVGRPALAALNNSFPPLRRFVADFRPATRSSKPALDASIPLVHELRGLVTKKELRGLVKDLRPTVPELAQLNNASIPLQEQVRAASSCQNEVIIPWSHDEISDSVFPATGKVFEESTKPLGGLAGESRSGDANGQWFRVLVNAGLYTLPLNYDRFLLTTTPLIGANPPPPSPHDAKSPLRPDVPCETQQAPDLRTNPADLSKKSRKVSQSGPGYAEMYAKGQAALNKRVLQMIKQEGLTNVIHGISSTPLTKAMLPKLRQLGQQTVATAKKAVAKR
jgi:phospholipid/cholesterol/gamma-HCH transport system substrate-binding protein